MPRAIRFLDRLRLTLAVIRGVPMSVTHTAGRFCIGQSLVCRRFRRVLAYGCFLVSAVAELRVVATLTQNAQGPEPCPVVILRTIPID